MTLDRIMQTTGECNAAIVPIKIHPDQVNCNLVSQSQPMRSGGSLFTLDYRNIAYGGASPKNSKQRTKTWQTN